MAEFLECACSTPTSTSSIRGSRWCRTRATCRSRSRSTTTGRGCRSTAARSSPASFQAYDQTYLVDALRVLGPGFVGVAQVPASISDAEVLALRDAGVRAFRLNLVRGGVVRRRRGACEPVVGARRLAPRGLRRRSSLPPLRRAAAGDRPPRSGAGRAAVRGAGRVREGVAVRRVDFDVAAVLRAIAAVNPAALLFGTDLPGTRAPRAF